MRHQRRLGAGGEKKKKSNKIFFLKISSKLYECALKEKNQEEKKMKKKASEVFGPVFYLWRILIVLNNMNMGRGGGTSTGEKQLQAAMLSFKTIIKRGFGSSPAAKFLC